MRRIERNRPIDLSAKRYRRFLRNTFASATECRPKESREPRTLLAMGSRPGSSEFQLSGARVAPFSDTFPPQVNGVANTVHRFALALGELGHEVRVFTISGSPTKELARYTEEKFS